jgi:hypothetical protein
MKHTNILKLSKEEFALRKFKSGSIPYTVAILFFILFSYSMISTILYDKNNILGYLIYGFCLIFSIFNLINIVFFISTSVNDKVIIQKDLFIKKSIYWDDISLIGLVVSNVKFFLFRYSISIYGNGKKINITNWTKDSKELIKIIVAECKKRDIKVEQMIEKIIED